MWSLILGIVGIWPVIVIGPILAITLGRRARREIAASHGAQRGGGMARAGIVLGWVGVGIVPAVVLAICGYAVSCSNTNCG